MDLELLSPKIIRGKQKIGELTIILSQMGSYEHTDPLLETTTTQSITTLYMGSKIEADLSNPPDERIKEYVAMRGLINICVNNAENIKERLLTILITPSKTSEERSELLKQPFTELKRRFMKQILDTQIYQEFETYNSTKKLKPFWDYFSTFIKDRNKYTHGTLCFIRPEFDFALEYIESGKDKRAYISKEVLLSYNSFYKEIIKVLNEYNAVGQSRFKDKLFKKNKI